MVNTDKPFDWHDYAVVEIPDTKFAKLVEASIDQIASTPEGKDLLVRGKANIEQSATLLPDHSSIREDHKIVISDKAPPASAIIKGSMDEAILGQVVLDPEQIGKIGYRNPQGGVQVMNLTDIAVHELFHQSDRNLTLQTLLSNSKSAASNMISVHETDPVKAEALKVQISKTAGEILFAHLGLTNPATMSPDERKAYFSKPENVQKYTQAMPDAAHFPEVLNSMKGEIAKRLHISPDSFNFSTADEIVKNVTAKLIDPKTGAPIIEESATLYSDAWAEKYFSEPPRMEYLRAGELPKEAQQEPRVYPFSCGPTTHIEYRNIDPATVDQMPQMINTPNTPCAAADQPVQAASTPRAAVKKTLTI